jgi:hypothetical protein
MSVCLSVIFLSLLPSVYVSFYNSLNPFYLSLIFSPFLSVSHSHNFYASLSSFMPISHSLSLSLFFSVCLSLSLLVFHTPCLTHKTTFLKTIFCLLTVCHIFILTQKISLSLPYPSISLSLDSISFSLKRKLYFSFSRSRVRETLSGLLFLFSFSQIPWLNIFFVKSVIEVVNTDWRNERACLSHFKWKNNNSTENFHFFEYCKNAKDACHFGKKWQFLHRNRTKLKLKTMAP